MFLRETEPRETPPSSPRTSEQLEINPQTMRKSFHIPSSYAPNAKAAAYQGDCLHLLRSLPNKSVSLVVTSPPYNIGKEYEKRRDVQGYIDWQNGIIKECHRVLADDG